MKKIAIFASGSGSNAQNIAQHFAQSTEIQISLILANRPDAYVLQRAQNLGIPQYVFDRDTFYQQTQVLAELQAHEIDFIVLAGFMWLIPDYLLEAYPNKIINIHPSLLPRYGGKGMYGDKVHQAVIAAADTHSGITIHYVNSRYDEGQVIYQATCPVLPTDTPETLATKIHDLEYEHFPKIIDLVVNQ
ncbi:MAG: phosphoribosylglycinamide formyltransferase [Bacteroidota bacterium]|jgi:phosphoribosylglycinamide formyltransferase-1